MSLQQLSLTSSWSLLSTAPIQILYLHDRKQVCVQLPTTTQQQHPFNGPLSGTIPGWAGTRKVKPIWILLKPETMSGSGISWAICKSAPRSRQITTPTPHHSVFYRPVCPSCRPTNSVKALKALISTIQYHPFNSQKFSFRKCEGRKPTGYLLTQV